MEFKGTKDGFHVRNKEDIDGHATWELWDGETFIVGAYGTYSLLAVGLLALDFMGGSKNRQGHPGVSLVLPPDERD